MLAHLTEIDYLRRFALVAIDPATHTGVAIARYEQTGGDAAELAIVVRPCWRRAGLATELISLLAGAALTHGIRTFTASYLAENRPVAALVKDAGGFSSQVKALPISPSSSNVTRPPARRHHSPAGLPLRLGLKLLVMAAHVHPQRYLPIRRTSCRVRGPCFARTFASDTPCE